MAVGEIVASGQPDCLLYEPMSMSTTTEGENATAERFEPVSRKRISSSSTDTADPKRSVSIKCEPVIDLFSDSEGSEAGIPDHCSVSLMIAY